MQDAQMKVGDTLHASLDQLRQLVEAKADQTAFSALLEVVRVSCSEQGEDICPVNLGSSRTHSRCSNTGYITRSWEGLPKGALTGALRYWAEQQFQSSLGKKANFFCDLASALDECLTSFNPDETATDAVIQVFKDGTIE